MNFEVYTLTDLSKEQILNFVAAKVIKDYQKFLAEIERQDVLALITRPQDLEEIINFWNIEGKIGSRYELMKHRINYRLSERDQDRGDFKSLALEKLQKGARLLAAASTLTRQPIIKILDGAHSSGALDVRSILDDWNDQECQILLSRPIFDEAIYGSVRFHHQTVKEYLTAEWFRELLKNSASRQRIENLFFRNQYGIDVILPSMKRILSWLVLFDNKIMRKVCLLEPEIILEEGDPNTLPLEQRKSILRSVCKRMASDPISRSMYIYTSAQQFVPVDMADDIKELIKKYHDNNEVLSYLLRMVREGRIKPALPDAKSYAQNPRVQNYIRVIAIKAVKAIGTAKDFNDLLISFISEKEDWRDLRILAELINNIDSNEQSSEWILEVLESIQDKKQYNVDDLTFSLENFIERADLNIVFKLLQGISKFLKAELFSKFQAYEISEQAGWLLLISLKALKRLISNKHEGALSDESVYILRQSLDFNRFNSYEIRLIKGELSNLVISWKELSHSLFWYNVQEDRRQLEKENKNNCELPANLLEGIMI